MSFRETARHYEPVLESIFEPQPRNPQKERKQNVKNFDEIITDQTKTAVKIPQSDYLKSGKYRIFDQGKEYSAGFSNEEIGAVKDFPYIIFGDHTRAVKFVNEPCFIGADGVKLLKVTNASFDAKYIYYNILAKPIESHGYTRHFKFLKEIKFTEKTLSEQKKIVTHLNSIQTAIDTKNKQLTQLEGLTKSKFIEMFGEPETNPNNFPKKKIDDFATCIAGATPSTKVPEYWKNGNVPWMSSGEVHLGRIYDTESKITKLGYDSCSTKMIPAHTVVIALAGQGKTRGTVGIAEISLCTNQSLCAVIVNKEANVDYLYSYLQLQYENLRRISNGDGGRGGLNLKIIGNFEVILPEMKLQNEWATYVKKIDSAKDIVKSQLKDLRELLDNKMDFYFGE